MRYEDQYQDSVDFYKSDYFKCVRELNPDQKELCIALNDTFSSWSYPR